MDNEPHRTTKDAGCEPALIWTIKTLLRVRPYVAGTGFSRNTGNIRRQPRDSLQSKALPCLNPIHPHRSTPVGHQLDQKQVRIRFPQRNSRRKLRPVQVIDLAHWLLLLEWGLNLRGQP